MFAAYGFERLEQPSVILVRPWPGWVEEERLARHRGLGREAREVDAEVDRVHPLRIQFEPLDRPFAHPLADHDHLVGPPCSAVVGEPPEEPLASREELRQIEVLDVEERDDSGTRHRRNRHGERIVHDLGCLERGSEGARTDGRRHHRAKPSGRRRGGAVPGRHNRREAGPRVWGQRRNERLIRVTPYPRESACELPGVASRSRPRSAGRASTC